MIDDHGFWLSKKSKLQSEGDLCTSLSVPSCGCHYARMAYSHLAAYSGWQLLSSYGAGVPISKWRAVWLCKAPSVVTACRQHTAICYCIHRCCPCPCAGSRCCCCCCWPELPGCFLAFLPCHHHCHRHLQCHQSCALTKCIYFASADQYKPCCLAPASLEIYLFTAQLHVQRPAGFVAKMCL